MSHHTDQWKEIERKVATILGGVRVPVPGRARGDEPDIRVDDLSPEVKHKKALPGWLHNAMAQAVAAKRGRQWTVVVLHEHGQRIEDSYCVLPLWQLAEMMEDVRGGAG